MKKYNLVFGIPYDLRKTDIWLYNFLQLYTMFKIFKPMLPVGEDMRELGRRGT